MTDAAAAQARAGRQSLEDSLQAEAEKALALFLVAVESEAVQALDGSYLVAVGLPRPFSHASLRMTWDRIVAPLKSVLSVDAVDAVYEQVTAILRTFAGNKAATKRELAKALRFEGASRWQAVAARQARTAATRQFAQRQIARFQAEGIAAKRWDADLDNATRPTHRAADGQTRPLGVAFRVGGEALQYPGDLTASPAETENCRCVIVPARASLAAAVPGQTTTTTTTTTEFFPHRIGDDTGRYDEFGIWQEHKHPRGPGGRFRPKVRIDHVAEAAKARTDLGWNGSASTPEQKAANARLNGLLDEAVAMLKEGEAEHDQAKQHEAKTLLHAGRPDLYKAPEPVKPPDPRLDSDKGIAEVVNGGGDYKALEGTKGGDAAVAAIRDWTDEGYATSKSMSTPEMKTMARLVAASKPIPVSLMRGLWAKESGNRAHLDGIRALKSAQPGDKVATDRLSSWTTSETAAQRYANAGSLSDKARAKDGKDAVEGVILKVQPGVPGLKVGRMSSFPEEEETVIGTSKLTVVSNVPHPSVEGLRVITVKAA